MMERKTTTWGKHMSVEDHYAAGVERCPRNEPLCAVRGACVRADKGDPVNRAVRWNGIPRTRQQPSRRDGSRWTAVDVPPKLLVRLCEK